MGMIMTNNKDLQNNMRHMYHYAWNMVTQSNPTTLHVTSTLQHVNFNNINNIHFIIPLFGITTKL